MNTRIRKHMKRAREENYQIRDYFKKCMPSIDKTNRYMLRKSCMYISCLYLVMASIAFFLVPDLKITIFSIGIVPLLVIYFFINLKTRNSGTVTTFQTSVMCLTFYFWVGLHFILIDVVANPDQPVRWFPLFLVCFPTVFIDRVFKYGIEETLMVILFIVASVHYKSEIFFRSDIYVVLAAYVLSMLSANILLRVRSYEALAMDQIRRLSTVDSLTRLLNKGALLEAIDKYFSRKPSDEPCALCVIDVDDFKKANDSLGHNKGDMLLAHIGSLLKKTFRNTDIIGRFGGDEFLILMPGMSNKELVEMRCRWMQMVLTDYDIGNSNPFSLSIGALVDVGGHPFDSIFRMADDALYESKILGKNCTTCWKASHKAVSDKPLLLLASIEDSIGAEKMLSMESDNYDILIAHTGNDALLYLSQYHNHICLTILELSIANITGFEVLKYAKTRDEFNSLPVIAVAYDENSLYKAQNMGADRVLMSYSSNEEYVSAINELKLSI